MGPDEEAVEGSSAGKVPTEAKVGFDFSPTGADVGFDPSSTIEEGAGFEIPKEEEDLPPSS